VRITKGIVAERTIVPRHPDEIVARVPSEMRPKVLADKRNLPRGLTPVFISRRFVSDSPDAEKVFQRIRDVLKKCKCWPVEALPENTGQTPPFYQVSSQMWISKAGIVLVMKRGIEGQAFTMNLAHEFGFLQGQGKPILVLVEKGAEQDMIPLSNALGINAPRFAPDANAFDPDHPESIDRRVKEWISALRKGRLL
jgi:hypothetical protein